VTRSPASLLSNTVTERTEAGEQLLAPFVAPVSVRQRLDHLMAQPLLPRKPQKPLGIGLGARAPAREAGPE
jgi:hypothetical protein